jgi:uncharacterized membrane protein YphA (DoxX/SURF4 family)
MARGGGPDPLWVDAILDWRWTWLFARLGLTSAYILGGLVKISDFQAAAAEQDHFGLHPGWIWACLSIAVEIGGPVLILSGRLVWLGAGALGVLTGIATLVANNFWVMTGHERFAATNAFFEHIGLIGGFVMTALIAEHVDRERSITPLPSPIA